MVNSEAKQIETTKKKENYCTIGFIYILLLIRTFTGLSPGE